MIKRQLGNRMPKIILRNDNVLLLPNTFHFPPPSFLTTRSARCPARSRISSPTHDEITRILVSVASKENLTLSPTLALSISRLSSRNLRRALLMLESAHTTDPDLDPGMQVPRCDWEEYIVKLGEGGERGGREGRASIVVPMVEIYAIHG